MDSKKEVFEIFEKLSDELEILNFKDRIEILVIGGSAMLILTDSFRPTIDIDAFQIIDGNLEEFNDLNKDVLMAWDINSGPSVFNELKECLSIDETYEVEYSSDKLVVYVPIIEQLILSKVFAIITRDKASFMPESINKDSEDIMFLLERDFDTNKLLGLFAK